MTHGMSLTATTELVRNFLDFFTLTAPTSPASPISGRALTASPGPAAVGISAHGAARLGPSDSSREREPAVATAVELTADTLEQIFLRCDIDTLVGVVPVVCKAWRAAATSPGQWRHRLSPKLMAQLGLLAKLGPPLPPSSLFLVMQGRNLLRNPTFRRELNSQPQPGRPNKYQRIAWVTTTAMGDGVNWEAPPAGMRTYGAAATADPPLPLPYSGAGGASAAAAAAPAQQLLGFFGNGSGGFGVWGGAVRVWDERLPGCLATANDWCEVVQVVDLQWELQRRGLSAAQSAALLDAGLGMRLSVHVGARWDCVGQYSVGLLLDEGTGNANGYGDGTAAVNDPNFHNHYGGGLFGYTADDAIPSLQSFVMRPTRHHFYTGRVVCTSDSWYRFEYSLPACPSGFRRAIIILRGRRAPNSLVVSPMPRYCGAKFASAELVFA